MKVYWQLGLNSYSLNADFYNYSYEDPCLLRAKGSLQLKNRGYDRFNLSAP